MILNTRKLRDFLAFSRLKPDFNLSNSLFAFIQPIDKEIFDSALLSLNLPSDTCFYWNNPESNKIFLSIGECYKINNSIHTDEFNFISNMDEFRLEQVPAIFVSIKFPSDKNDSVWQVFDQFSYSVPRLIFYTENNLCYLIIFLSPQEINSSNNIIDELEKKIESIGSNKISFYSPATYKIISKTSYDEWTEMVNYALRKISEDVISKVVLSRILECEISCMPNLIHIISKLKEDYPESSIFIYRRWNSIFLGASPEKLLVINKNKIETEALAGTTKRGETDSADNQLSNLLLNDKKELAEHNNVVEYIVKIISEFAAGIQFGKPSIKKLKYIQHLWTPIKADLIQNISVFNIINKLHPTPAVCGDPKESALELINKLENFERGLFTGVLGWYSNNGLGEFTVAIRSALINYNKLLVYAGCGIVEGSIPEKEFYETELKLKSILSLFQHEPSN
ncbi:MAG: isochorismate synthase [Bacteroidota bacterium]